MEKIEETTLKDINDIYLTFFFEENERFIFKKENTSEKFVIVEEKLGITNTDCIGNLEDLPQFIIRHV